MILVSACLLGEKCKYNGENNYNPQLIRYLHGRGYIGACPETLGGLTAPRQPAELQGGDGEDFWAGKATVMDQDGCDLSTEFAAGAAMVLQICRDHQIQLAILKESSPSCGSSCIYDGTFSHKRIPGCGVCAALLKQNGIRIISEKEIPDPEE